MAKSKSTIYIGVSGWTFPGWKDVFYPKEVKKADELKYASSKLRSIEVNGTFHAMQKPESFQRWYTETPSDFMFSLKAPRYMTHIRRLRDSEEALCNFLASGVLCLKEKLGPILWQFPPSLSLETMTKTGRLETFLKILPRDTFQAAELAKNHTDRMEGRAFVEAGTKKPHRMRHAFEFRHPSFANADFVELLRENGMAWVFAHAGKKNAPYYEELTTDFLYFRMHAVGEQYRKGYPLKEIRLLKKRLDSWMNGEGPKDQVVLKDVKKFKKRPKEVFLYFDNDEKVHAPRNALELLKEFK